MFDCLVPPQMALVIKAVMTVWVVAYERFVVALGGSPSSRDPGVQRSKGSGPAALLKYTRQL